MTASQSPTYFQTAFADKQDIFRLLEKTIFNYAQQPLFQFPPQQLLLLPQYGYGAGTT